MSTTMAPYVFAGLIGAFLSISELMGRYKDSPFSAIRNVFTIVYAFINSFASILTLYMILDAGVFEWPEKGIASSLPAKVIIAGLGAMTLLRLGISVQVSGDTINFSLASLLKPILRAADSEVDRGRAANRLMITKKLLLGLNVSAALSELPMLCLSQMQGIPEEEQKRLADDVKAVSAQTVSDDAKLIALGSILLNTVGEAVLKGAVEFFRESQVKLVADAKLADAPPPAAAIVRTGVRA